MRRRTFSVRAGGVTLSELPFPEVGPAFMREVAELHGELFPEYAEVYGDDVARKLKRCLAVTDADYERAARAREDCRAIAGEAFRRR